MPFAIIRNDITQMAVDAIVNTANPFPRIGSGLDTRIHLAAGPQLLKARQAVGPIPRGQSRLTPGFSLPAPYVIHTVGPVWRGGLMGEEKLLRSCYDSALALALEAGCTSIAFPLISAGNYRFPREKVLTIATDAFRDFLQHHEMQITLVVYDRESFQVSRKLFRNVTSFLEEHYIEPVPDGRSLPDFRTAPMVYPRDDEDFSCPFPQSAVREPEILFEDAAPESPGSSAPRKFPAYRHSRIPDRASAPRPMPVSAPKTAPKIPPAPRPDPLSAPDLDAFLSRLDAGFSQTLLELIDKTGKKDAEIYTKANLSRQHFSKIRSNPNYHPTKPTALALALALELDLSQTQDLIGRAGYTLTNSSQFDLIIMYFIQCKNYNLFDINSVLFQFDQSLLGAQMSTPG